MNPVSMDQVEFLNPGYLTIQNGRIERLSANDPRAEFSTAEFIDYTEFALLPGFVDTHVHLRVVARPCSATDECAIRVLRRERSLKHDYVQTSLSF